MLNKIQNNHAKTRPERGNIFPTPNWKIQRQYPTRLRFDHNTIALLNHKCTNMLSDIRERRHLRRGVFAFFNHFWGWNPLRKRLVDVVPRVAHIFGSVCAFFGRPGPPVAEAGKRTQPCNKLQQIGATRRTTRANRCRNGIHHQKWSKNVYIPLRNNIYAPEFLKQSGRPSLIRRNFSTLSL